LLRPAVAPYLDVFVGPVYGRSIAAPHRGKSIA